MSMNIMTANRVQEIENALFDAMNESSQRDRVPAASPEKIAKVFQNLSTDELLYFHDQMMEKFGGLLVRAAMLESYVFLRPSEIDGAVIQIHVDGLSGDVGDALWLRDLLSVTQKELDNRPTERA